MSMYMYSFVPATPKQQGAMEDASAGGDNVGYAHAKHPLEKV